MRLRQADQGLAVAAPVIYHALWGNYMEAGGTTALSGLPISNPPGRFMPPIRDFSNQNGFERARLAADLARAALSAYPNVVGIGVGAKRIAG